MTGLFNQMFESKGPGYTASFVSANFAEDLCDVWNSELPVRRRLWFWLPLQ